MSKTAENLMSKIFFSKVKKNANGDISGPFLSSKMVNIRSYSLKNNASISAEMQTFGSTALRKQLCGIRLACTIIDSWEPFTNDISQI